MKGTELKKLVEVTIERVVLEIPDLLENNKKEILSSITGKFDPKNPTVSIDAGFSITAKLKIEGGKCNMDLAIGWSNSFKQTHPQVVIDLHPQLDINPGE